MGRVQLNWMRVKDVKDYVVVKVDDRTSGFVWRTFYHGDQVWCSSATGACIYTSIRGAIRSIVKYYDDSMSGLAGDAASRDTEPR